MRQKGPISELDLWGYEIEPARVTGIDGLEEVDLPPVVTGPLCQTDAALDELLRLRDAVIGPLA